MASLRRCVAALAVLLCSLSGAALADSLTCKTLSNTSDITLDHPFELSYTHDNGLYWSTGCSALKPACIIKPSTADEVSHIVKVLNQNNELFAIKSGGHNPNQHFNAIKGGPLIDTKLLDEVTLDAQAKTVRVGPGNRWEDVHKVLDGSGYTVVGGRIGNVGVGGYMLGGGLSFLSAQYGWAANNVVEFEVVLANGTITTASCTTNPDLFKALKGGGANFGIVTAYTLRAHQIGQVWGGNLVFAADKTDDLLAAVRNFTANYPDEKAGVIVTSEITAASLVHIWILFLFYDGPTPPEGTFNLFTDLKPLSNNCKTRSYYDLLGFNDWSILHGSVYTIATEMTPVPAADDMALMHEYHDHWINTTHTVLDVPGLVASMAFQPFPASMAKRAQEIDAAEGGTGDLIGFDDAADRIIFEFDYSYVSMAPATLNQRVDDATVALYSGIRDRVTAAVDKGRVPDVYLPIFMNDGYFRQDYWGRLGQTEWARAVRDRYDPHTFWTERTPGGFKL
ncbi:uncharacterized protein K452DRAFT_225838 [Aplosporella prunicola CBS 121167]|uniref:FAD-binding PCMH-type domain-containing protein n=1 Tax=Aplosporella prunicola CBS 121167 TaxID=1176127 RepID=A0A6A6BHS0_9PEZI|nr:uncharacterized protein K452DRAFT_225838 [Aplosporella prunicola CBS 121167]KAF2142885.1 hypothetical protein K452DRAFT_225838 [Aplosporella prunicola CBS 121167]